MSKALHCKRWRWWRMPLLPSKSLQMRLPCLQWAPSSLVRCINITTFLRKGLKREQNQSKSLRERKSCMCLCNNGMLKNLPWQPSTMTAHCFCGFTLHARQGKWTCQNCSGMKTSQDHYHWTNWVICGQVKRQTCWSVLNVLLLDLGMLMRKKSW